MRIDSEALRLSLTFLVAAACSASEDPLEPTTGADAGTETEPGPDAGRGIDRDAGGRDAGGRDAGAAGCQPPCFAWARMLTGPSEEDEIDAVASDPSANVFISGKFEQALTIEGHPTALESVGRADIMLAKLSPAGETLWVRHYGGPGEDNVFDAACDEDGNVYLSGYFGGTVAFGDFTLSTTSPADLDMMLLKVSPDGEVLWALQTGSPEADGGNEVNVGPDGSVVVLVDSAGSLEAGELSFEGSGDRDSFVLVVAPESGEVTWGAQVGGPGLTRGKCLTVDERGRVYFGGDYAGGAVDARSVSGRRLSLPAADRDTDAFLTAWTSEGELRWVKSWGGPESEFCKAAVAGAPGQLHVITQLAGDASFDGRILQTTRSALAVWQLTDEGETRWLEMVRGDGAPLFGAEATTGPDGGILFGHQTRSDVVYGAAAGEDRVVTLPQAGRWPSFVGYSADGIPALSLLPAESETANFGEISRSGRRVYIDVPIAGGQHRFGPDVREGGPTKDALIVAIDL